MATQNIKTRRPRQLFPVYRYAMAAAISMKLTLLILLYPFLQGTARLALVGIFGTAIVIQIVILAKNIRRDLKRQRGLSPEVPSASPRRD